jgi:hypothetical protein
MRQHGPEKPLVRLCRRGAVPLNALNAAYSCSNLFRQWLTRYVYLCGRWRGLCSYITQQS